MFVSSGCRLATQRRMANTVFFHPFTCSTTRKEQKALKPWRAVYPIHKGHCPSISAQHRNTTAFLPSVCPAVFVQFSPPWWPPCLSLLSPVAESLLTGPTFREDCSWPELWTHLRDLWGFVGTLNSTAYLLTLPRAPTVIRTSLIKVLKMTVWRGRIWLSDIMECDGWMWNPPEEMKPTEFSWRRNNDTIH